jgi:hypothetical protein
MFKNYCAVPVVVKSFGNPCPGVGKTLRLGFK